MEKQSNSRDPAKEWSIDGVSTALHEVSKRLKPLNQLSAASHIVSLAVIDLTYCRISYVSGNAERAAESRGPSSDDLIVAIGRKL